jgi:hypothetical protein
MRLPRNDAHAIQPLIDPEEIVENRAKDPALQRGQRRSELGGMCCECCVGSSLGRLLSGRFPNFTTGNQFFTPVVWANFVRLGFELADEPVRLLIDRRAEAAAAGLENGHAHAQAQDPGGHGARAGGFLA